MYSCLIFYSILRSIMMWWLLDLWSRNDFSSIRDWKGVCVCVCAALLCSQNMRNSLAQSKWRHNYTPQKNEGNTCWSQSNTKPVGAAWTVTSNTTRLLMRVDLPVWMFSGKRQSSCWVLVCGHGSQQSMEGPHATLVESASWRSFCRSLGELKS